MKNFCTFALLGVVMTIGMTSTAVQASTTACVHQEKDIQTMKKDADNIQKSRCMIELILEDLTKNYNGIGGGGISSITATSSTSYTVSLPQEERIDLLTYEFMVRNDGTASIKRRFSSTQNVSQKPPATTETK